MINPVRSIFQICGHFTTIVVDDKVHMKNRTTVLGAGVISSSWSIDDYNALEIETQANASLAEYWSFENYPCLAKGARVL